MRVNNRVEEELGTGWLPERAVAGWQRSADDINDAAGFLIDNGMPSRAGYAAPARTTALTSR